CARYSAMNPATTASYNRFDVW
nr:immunoglobulin heavy chain junction region [Macaca mulatta]MOW88570.1 immunoglobulin heavy chain junction region [Macaca mulatta]MOW92081.1 immunoglobulin heavy chain junction region [Macaca mulatta]